MALPDPESGLVISYAYLWRNAHTPPIDSAVAVEIPLAVKRHLGLDSERSWVVLDDLNMFTWPGFDLALLPGSKDRYHYGFLPPLFYRKLIEKFSELRRRKRAAPTSRDDA